MIWHIARKEILENLRSYRFFILMGLLCVLIAVSVIVSYGDYELRMEHYNLTRPGPNSSNVMLPPNPLAIFAKGAEANIGRLYWVHAGNIEVESSEQSINRLFSLFTVPDMLFIVKVVLSLIALLFSFDAITDEKENGTMKLTLATGTRRTSLLFGKLTGRLTLVILPFAILFLAAALVVSLLPNVQAGNSYWLRIFVILLLSAVYSAVFIALGLLLSLLAHRSSTSLAFCLVAWVLFIFILPQAGASVATALAGVPPAERIELEQRLTSVRLEYEQVLRERSSGQEPGRTMQIQDTRDSYKQINESYRQKLNVLLHLTKELARTSPAGSLTFLVTDVLNTGLYEELRLKDNLWLYMDRNFNALSGAVEGNVDAFDYERASMGEVLSQSGISDLVVLVLFGLGFAALGMAAFARYDPR